MKKIYFYFSLLLTVLAQAQGNEDFTNSNATATYAANTFVGNGSVTWTYAQARNQGTGADDYSIVGNGIMLRRASDSYLEATITGGIGNLQFKYRKAFTGNSARQLEVLINGSQVATTAVFGVTPAGADATINNFNFNVNQPGSVTLRIKNVGTATTNTQTTIDDIVWTSFSGTASPSIAISSPANNTNYNPEVNNVDINLSVLNFNVALSGFGDGWIKYSFNSAAFIDKFDTSAINVGLVAGANTLTVKLVDNVGTDLSPSREATITLNKADYTAVANLADLRTQPLNGYYSLSSAPVTTHVRPVAVPTTMVTRNQKYVQDATAAILIDDAAGVLNGLSIVESQSVAGLKGQLTSFSSVLQFVPLTSVGVVNTTTTPVSAATLTLADITANPAGFRESELVNLGNVTFSNLVGTPIAVNTNYTIGQGADTTVFRTLFNQVGEVDYIGTTVPGSADVIAIVTRNGATKQVVVRKLADMTNLSRNNFNAIEGLSIYPNPVTGKSFQITSATNTSMSVSIYDVVGKEVLASKVINNTVNIEALNTGIYIVKVTEEGKTATRKLIVE